MMTKKIDAIYNSFNHFKSTIYFEYLLVMLFGGMIACGLPPMQIYSICIIGFLFAFHHMQKVTSKRRAVFLMIFLFLGYFILSSFWLMNPFLNTDKFVAKLMLPIGVLGILFASTIYALPFFFLPLFKKTIYKVLSFACLFAISEWIRSFVFVGFGYNMLGTMWFDAPVISQSASIFGVYGLTFFTVLIFTYPHLFYSEKKHLKKLLLPTAFLISLIGLFICWGMWRLHFSDERFFNDKKIRIVQPSIDTVYEYVPSIIYRNTEDIKLLTQAKNVDDVVAIFLHETAIRSYLSNAQKYVIQDAVGDVIPKGGFLISGMPRMEYGWNDDYTEFGKNSFNSVMALDSEFEVQGKYFKKRLVPFGEYVPQVFKMFLPDVLTAGIGFAFPKHQDEQLIKLERLPALSISLCNEDGHAGQFLRYDFKSDVGAIVNVANISWFGEKSSAAIQNYAYAVMRAIEEGLPNIRVVNRGISGVISPYGKMIEGDAVIVDRSDYQTVLFDGKRDKIMPDEAGIIDLQIPVRIYKTFYSMVGNYFVISALMLILFIMLILDKKSIYENDGDSNCCKNCSDKNKLSLMNILKMNVSKQDAIFVSGYLLAFFMGAFMVLVTPPFNLFFPSIISISVMYFAFEKYKNEKFFALLLLMFLFFYGYFFFGSAWLTSPMRLAGVHNAFNRYAEFFRWFLPVLMALGASLFFPFIAKIKSNWLRFLGFAIAFALGEWLRSQSFWATGFPYIYLGAIWIPVKPVLQFASLFGIYGLTFITVILFSSFGVAFIKYFRRRYLYIILSGAIFGSIFAWGNNRIQVNIYNPDLSLRLVQPLKDRRLDSDQESYVRENVSRVINISNYEISKETNLIVMPESVFPYNLASSSVDPTYRKEYVDIVKKSIPKNGYLIAGFIGKFIVGNIFDQQSAKRKFYNMIGVFNDNGEMISDYKKVHLVPLGEYVPDYLSTFFPRKLTSGGNDLTPGLSRNVVHNKSYQVVTPFVANLCYEENYSGQITDKKIMENSRVDWLLNLTDDIWFRDSYLPYQHFDASIMRAVEEGLPYVRVSNDGPSAVIDAYGRLVDGQATVMNISGVSKIKKADKKPASILNYNDIGVLDVKLPLPPQMRTLYSKTGDALVLSILGVMFFASFVIDFILKKSYLKIFGFFKSVKNGFNSMMNYWRGRQD